LEKMMADAVSLRDQMKRLNLNKRITRAVTRRDGHALLREARKEAAPTAQRKYPAGLSGDAEHIIPLNIPRHKI